MHVQIVSLSTGKSGPTFILALGMWAGAEMGGFKQLEDDLPADSLEQLGRNCHWQLELAQKQSSLMTPLQQAMAQKQLRTAKL